MWAIVLWLEDGPNFCDQKFLTVSKFYFCLSSAESADHITAVSTESAAQQSLPNLQKKISWDVKLLKIDKFRRHVIE